MCYNKNPNMGECMGSHMCKTCHTSCQMSQSPVMMMNQPCGPMMMEHSCGPMMAQPYGTMMNQPSCFNK